MRRFEPSEQQSDYLLNRRTDAINRNSGAYLRELLVSRNAKYLERFRPLSGYSRGDELRRQQDEWEED